MKGFFSTVAGIIIVIVVILVILVFLGWSRIPDILAHHLSKEMKVLVEIEDVKLSMRSIDIEKLEIGNPSGYVLPKAFSANTININAPLRNYLDQEIIIDQILIDKVYLGLEFDSPRAKRGNWTTIMGNMKASQKPGGKGKQALIRSLILTNISIDLAFKTEGGRIRRLAPIKRLEFKDVSTEKGIPTEQISNIILSEMLRSIFRLENLQNMLEDLLQSPQTPVNQFLQPLKKILP
jgi:uncharacterized protein involved in outer membrane biogenesis